jgi:hypothetical protein
MPLEPSIFHENATRIRGLCKRIDETFHSDPHGPEHHAACAEFHGKFDQLAFPGGLSRQLARLADGNTDAVDDTIAFLTADPRFFRSGYIKEKMLRRLKHVSLSSPQRRELRRLVVRSVDRGGRREFHAYARLAGALDSAEVTQEMERRLRSPSAEVRRRAAEVLHVMTSRKGEAKTNRPP